MYIHVPTMDRQDTQLLLENLAHPGWLPGPLDPELAPWARGAAAEPQSERRQGKFGANGKRPPSRPVLGRKRTVTVREGGPLPPGRPQGCGRRG